MQKSDAFVLCACHAEQIGHFAHFCKLETIVPVFEANLSFILINALLYFIEIMVQVTVDMNTCVRPFVLNALAMPFSLISWITVQGDYQELGMLWQRSKYYCCVCKKTSL